MGSNQSNDQQIYPYLLEDRTGLRTSLTLLGCSQPLDISAPLSSGGLFPSYLGAPIHLPRGELGQLPAGAGRGRGGSHRGGQDGVGELEQTARSLSGPAPDQVMQPRCGLRGGGEDLRAKTSFPSITLNSLAARARVLSVHLGL